MSDDALDPYLDEFRDNPRGPTTPLAVREAIGNDPDLGKVPDPAMAARYNVPVTVVRYVRQLRGVKGIPGKPGGLSTEEARALAEARWQAAEAARAAAPAAPPPPPPDAPRPATRPLPGAVEGRGPGRPGMDTPEGRRMAELRWDQTVPRQIENDPQVGLISDVAMAQKYNTSVDIARRARRRAGFDRVRAAWQYDPDLWRVPAAVLARRYNIPKQSVSRFKATARERGEAPPAAPQPAAPAEKPAPRPPLWSSHPDYVPPPPPAAPAPRPVAPAPAPAPRPLPASSTAPRPTAPAAPQPGAPRARGRPQSAAYQAMLADPDRGKISDYELARRHGGSRQMAKRARQDVKPSVSGGVPPPSDTRTRIANDPRLGQVPDAVLEREYGVSHQTVMRAREDAGIPAFQPDQPAWQSDPMIGWEPDEVVGNRHNVPKEVVFRFRKRHGIPSATERAGLAGSQWIQPEDAERREQIAALLQADPDMANREIARQTGSSQDTVRAVRESLGMPAASKGDRSEIAREVAAKGGTVEEAAQAAGLSYSAAYTAIQRGGMKPVTARARSEIAREVAAKGGTAAEAAQAAGLSYNAAQKVLARAKRAGAPSKVEWDQQLHRLGKMPDGVLADLLSRELGITIDRSTVAYARKARGIPAFTGAAAPARAAPASPAASSPAASSPAVSDEAWIKAGLFDDSKPLGAVAAAVGSSKAEAARVLKRLVGGAA